MSVNEDSKTYILLDNKDTVQHTAVISRYQCKLHCVNYLSPLKVTIAAWNFQRSVDLPRDRLRSEWLLEWLDDSLNLSLLENILWMSAVKTRSIR